MSTGSRSAPPNCGRRPPRTGPSWHCSRSGTRHEQDAPGCCWPGASDGAGPASRAPALAAPAVRPSASPELTDGLVALRGVSQQLEQARSLGTPMTALLREQARLEKRVRASALRAPGQAATERGGIRVADLLDELGAGQLIEIADIDGQLYVLVCGAGGGRQVSAGRTADAARAADFARFALRRLARARPGDDPGSALAVLAESGSRLEYALLGPAVR